MECYYDTLSNKGIQRKSTNLGPIVFHLMVGQQLSLVIFVGVPLKNDTEGLITFVSFIGLSVITIFMCICVYI